MDRVIIIDDDAAVLASLDALFTSANYEVQAFALAKDFLDVLETLSPACIVTDLTMPEMDGLALTHRLKTDLGLPWPVILISGHADPSHAAAAKSAGAAAFLTKPFPPQILLAAVRSSLVDQKRWLGELVSGPMG